MNWQHRHAGLWAQAMVLAFAWSEICASSAQLRFTLVEGGVSRAPIVVVESAPPLTRRAADELALYIEKVSGARPKVLEGLPDPLPDHAVWVGYQPALDTLHRLLRAGETLRSDENPSVRIKPNRRHRIVAENDAGRVRLTVDGRMLLEGTEKASFVGPGQDRAGLYLYTPARVFSVKLYVKPLADDSI